MDENYTSLFDAEGEMLNIKQIIDLLKHLSKQEPMVYRGKGDFAKMIINLDKGIKNDILKKHNKLNLPYDYVELLKFSNGISFYEYGDAVLNSLENAVEYSQDEWLSQGYINIASCGGDEIYLKCDNSQRNIYVSDEGFGELRPLNMSFIAFIEASLISGFSYFWHWGTKELDLY